MDHEQQMQQQQYLLQLQQLEQQRQDQHQQQPIDQEPSNAPREFTIVALGKSGEGE